MEKCFQGRFLINPVFLSSIILFNSGKNKKLSPGGAASKAAPHFLCVVGETILCDQRTVSPAPLSKKVVLDISDRF